MNFLTIILSIILDRTGTMEIGLKSLALAGLAILGTGMMQAAFHWLSTIEFRIDKLKSPAIGRARKGAMSLRNHAGIPSTPVAVGMSLSSFKKISISSKKGLSPAAVNFNGISSLQLPVYCWRPTASLFWTFDRV